MLEKLTQKFTQLFSDEASQDVILDADEMEERMENITMDIPRVDINWEEEL